LQSVSIGPSSISFSSTTIGAKNQTSINDPLYINNTGNFNFTIISINSTNLPGAINATEFIPSANFSVGVTSTGATYEECGDSITTTEVNDTVLAAQVYKILDIANLTRGNYSLATNKNITGQEGLFFCIRGIPSDISSQTYSTTATSSWTVQLV
jgi:hypothetical protein